MRQLIRTYSITGAHQITVTGYTFTKQDIRLIINETLASSATTDEELIASVLVSSTKKDNVTSVQSGVITLASATANLTVGDELTIEIDIDNVAKQGTDPSVTLTSVDEKIDDFYDTFDADMALQLQGIIGEEESESESDPISGNSQTEGEIERLRTLQESYDVLNEKYQTMADAWAAMVTNKNSVAGWKMYNMDVVGVGSVLIGMKSYLLNEIDDNILETYPANLTLINSQPYLTKINFRNLKYLSLRSDLSSLNALQEILLPEVLECRGHGGASLQGNPVFKHFYAPKCTYFYTDIAGPFSNCPQLIDIELGEVNSNILLGGWSPAEALLNNSTSLVNDGETFTSNLEKLLYNIREHIAARIQNRTGLSSLTITFSAAVKAAIQADTATSNAFTNKNWVIA